ncbi:PRC-barrel domain containing protein [Aestuariicella hydrocarbonica]|uniref:PRC-barrel domain containing protein n=1 Tax=Pseudomaricurvus hydrocarbonicus TaxID=1470433 RepID=A0A9E5JP83_9GAMM|nr:PRC-barrel domain-containing protein [Aestuariicella hydrocarbonica]NHO63974.1 PRC-barrel domain containing protein [Aestuariicella hydrocarbonica]
MKKLHSFALYALVTPAITLGAGSLLAEKPTPSVTQDSQSTQRAEQSDSRTAADRQDTRDQSRMQHRGYMSSAPANGMQASDLIGTEVKTTGDEDVGPVNDLIINKNGQVVAIVVNVGGFLGMGEEAVAIGWDDVTRSGTSDKPELRIDLTRENLRSAPEFEKQK